MHYRNFTIEDFLADDFFQEWVLRPDTESNVFWQNWIRENPDKKALIEQAVAIVYNNHFPEQWSAQERSEMWKNIQQQLIPADVTRPQVFRLTGRKIWLAAASLVFILGSIGILFQQSGMKETSTSFGQIKKITLADGSIVTLNSNSRLRYAADFLGTNEREIWVDGEAFFEVKKRIVHAKKIPFTVHANDLSIQVLGTAFNVTNRRGTVNVALEHGAVKVIDKKNKDNSVLLKPGESATQSDGHPTLTKEKVAVEDYSSWKNKVIVFRKKSLVEISEMMKDLYGMQVVIDNPALEKETFTGSFPSDSSQVLFQKLEKMFPMEVTRNGDEYHLK
ncbi:hypothetical protein DYBT9275_02365 [Dyadobacter sp. CECT 9275]|uniref:FecR family protein n=2 Tax=Dyadobacter helix TaxID=2822344 RepID=A0A916JC01_9BACT|nr:hypothetical protein DYBT9275_02365 [Dyadobacter sp. CECT 9275]